ncbi:helix-turn-helix domain-containing protein [Streptomyces indonesiensis]
MADLGVDQSTVDRWRARFVADRLDGLQGEPRSGYGLDPARPGRRRHRCDAGVWL